MKAFARVTAFIFMALGVVLILVGAFFAFSNFISASHTAPSSTIMVPDVSGLVVVAKFIAGAVTAMQGLYLAAIGQAIWLLANISDHTEKTKEYLGALARRSAQPKQ